MKIPTLILFLILLLPGCSTVAKYESKVTAGPAKPADYPIYIYPQEIMVPRPCEIIGTIRVSDSLFTVMGGSLEDTMKKLRANARQKGADAVKLTAINPPGFANAHYEVEANFLRFTNAWESMAFSEDELLTYYRTKGPTLDPIEGIWSGNDTAQSRVAIIKNNSKPRRDFFAFILSTKNPTWQRGDKKMDIRRGERPGVYRGNYYLDDYEETGLAFTLRDPPATRFIIPISDESDPVIFTRE